MGTLACDLGCFPFDNGAYPPLSHCPGPSCGIRGLVKFGRLTPPYLSSALPPQDYPNAVPKYISGRTSYLRVRLAFHPYPQLIPAFCTRHGFGPPSRYHRDFNLAMGSSPGFGSNPNNTLGLMETLFQVCSQFSSIRKLCPKTQLNDRLEWEFGPSTSSPPS